MSSQFFQAGARLREFGTVSHNKSEWVGKREHAKSFAFRVNLMPSLVSWTSSPGLCLGSRSAKVGQFTHSSRQAAALSAERDRVSDEVWYERWATRPSKETPQQDSAESGEGELASAPVVASLKG